MKLAWASVAALVIAPLQDLLNVGNRGSIAAVTGTLVFQIGEIEKDFLRANWMPEFSHNLCRTQRLRRRRINGCNRYRATARALKATSRFTRLGPIADTALRVAIFGADPAAAVE